MGDLVTCCLRLYIKKVKLWRFYCGVFFHCTNITGFLLKSVKQLVNQLSNLKQQQQQKPNEYPEYY